MVDQRKNLTRMDIKRNNRIRVYNELRQRGKLSCLDISKGLGVSLPTVNKNLASLEEARLIHSPGTNCKTGGRSSKIYEVVKDFRVAVGVNITNHHITAVTVNLTGEVTARVRFRQPFSRDDAYCRRLGQAVEQVISEGGISKSQILGVALVIPALILPDGSRTYYNRVLPMDSNVTCEELARYIPYPARLCHDAKSAAYAESWFNREVSDFFYMMISDSLCGAPVLSGKPYSGLNNRSGEIAHLKLVSNGRLCFCGKRGCMDPYCSTKALTSATVGDLAAFFDRLEAGDPEAGAVWEEYLYHLALAINSIRMMLDCPIILGGYLGQYMDGHLPHLKELVLAEDPFTDQVDYLSVCKCKNEASATGGALVYIEQFIQTV